MSKVSDWIKGRPENLVIDGQDIAEVDAKGSLYFWKDRLRMSEVHLLLKWLKENYSHDYRPLDNAPSIETMQKLKEL